MHVTLLCLYTVFVCSYVQFNTLPLLNVLLVLVSRYSASSSKKISYFQVTDISNGTADTIETLLLQVLREKEIDISKLCGFGSDSAAVMVGRRNGVATKLKIHSPRMVSVHCINHRLALATAHAAKSISYLKRFKSTLQSLFYFKIVQFAWLDSSSQSTNFKMQVN